MVMIVKVLYMKYQVMHMKNLLVTIIYWTLITLQKNSQMAMKQGSSLYRWYYYQTNEQQTISCHITDYEFIKDYISNERF